MRKLLIGLLFLVAGAANAGYVEDSFKAGSTEEMCGAAGQLVMDSIKKRLENVPLLIKDAGERTSPNPKDAIYMYNWKTIADDDKVFLTRFVEFGYSIADRAVKSAKEANVELLFPDHFMESYNAFMAACYTMKNTNEDWFKQHIIKSNFIKTGSAPTLSEEQATDLIMRDITNAFESLGVRLSEEDITEISNRIDELAASNGNLGKTPIGMDEARYQRCEELLYDLNLIARFISEGEEMEVVLGLASRSVGNTITQERFDRLERQITEAYALTTPIADWIEKEYQECR